MRGTPTPVVPVLPRSALCKDETMLQSEVDASCQRIADDLVVDSGDVLGMRASFNATEGSEADWDWWDFTLTLNGEPIGSFGTRFPPSTEEFTAHLADYLQEHLSQSIWGGWPMCPDHPNHPLVAEMSHERAVWSCPRGREVARIGDLAKAGP
jgi:hypothetical protein